MQKSNNTADDGRTVKYIQNNKLCVSRTICFTCNNRCISCINDFEEHKNNNFQDTEKLKGIIDCIDKNTSTISFNGGEPTIRKDLIEILSYTRNKFPNSLIQLLTNGRMFAYKKYLNSFLNKQFQNFDFFISLYGHNSRIHDAITRAPGSFNQTTKGIKNLLENFQTIEIRVIINKINYKHLEEIAQFIRTNFITANFAPFRIVFVNMKVTGEAKNNYKSILVPYQEIVPYAIKAINILQSHNVKYYHCPLCLLPEKYRDFAKGITIAQDQIIFPKECDDCILKSDCPGIWKSYFEVLNKIPIKAIIEK